MPNAGPGNPFAPHPAPAPAPAPKPAFNAGQLAAGSPAPAGPPNPAFADTNNKVQRSNFQYGGTLTGADDQVSQDINTANDAALGMRQIGQQEIQNQHDVGQLQGQLSGRQMAQADAVAGRGNALGGQAAGYLQQATQAGPSAAQAQLAQATNQNVGNELALARSGRGMGGSASALRQAAFGGEAAQQTAAGQSAVIAAQEDQAAKARALQAGGISAQYQGQQNQLNDQTMLGLQQMGGTNLNAMGSTDQAGYNSWLQSQQGAGAMQLQGLQLAQGVRDTQAQQGIAEQNALDNVYGINSQAQTAQNQLDFQKVATVGGAILGAAGGFMVGGPAGAVAGGYGGYKAGEAASDTDAKKDKAEAKGFAKGVQATAEQLGPPTAAQRLGGALMGAAGAKPAAQQATGGNRPGNRPPWVPPNISSMSGGANISAAMNASRGAPVAQAKAGAAIPAAAAAPAAAAMPAPLYGRNARFGTVDYNPYGRVDERGPAGAWGVATDQSEFGGPPPPPIDPSTVTPATSTNTWAARAYGLQNPPIDAPANYGGTPAPAAAEPAVSPRPVSNAAPWLDQYMASQQQQTSDTDAKKSKERAAGFADAMQQIDPSTAEFERAAPRRNIGFNGLDIDALDEAQRRQGGPVNDMRPAVGYTYQYKDPNMPGAKPGTVAGPMAQDLEHTIAADAVHTGPDGYKRVDTSRLSLHNTAAIGEQQTEIEKLKAKLDALAGAKPVETGAPATIPRISQVDTSAFAPVRAY